MSKNIVLCFDGTSNTFGRNETNVLQIFKALPKSNPGQVTFYDPGVGALRMTSVYRRRKYAPDVIAGLAVGQGIFKNLEEGYRFLMRHYTKGDQVFLFGFSRGAYTARLLAGLVNFAGLLQAGRENLFPHILDTYTRREREADFDCPDPLDPDYVPSTDVKPPWKTGMNARATFGRECVFAYAGLFDTVTALGSNLKWLRYPHTDGNESVSYARHALALDERRGFYIPHPMHSKSKRGLHSEVDTAWFAGAHSDVGGAYCGNTDWLGRLALEWVLIGACRAGLILCKDKALRSVTVDAPLIPPLYTLHQSLTRKWRLAEAVPRYVYSYAQQKWVLRANRFRPREVPEGAKIHLSVFQRMNEAKGYKPPNLPQAYTVEPWETLAEAIESSTRHTKCSKG